MLMRIFTFFLIINSVAYANFMEVSQESKEKRVIDKKWAFNLGADYRKVETGFPEFDGRHSDIEADDAVEVWGVDLGLSRVIMNIGNFELETRLSVIYAKTVQNTKGLAAKEYDDIDLANERVDYQLLSGRVSAIFGYTFETKLINIKPYIEIGSGAGSSVVEKEYTFEGIETDNSDYEHYDYKVENDFIFTEVALGLSFVGKDGFFSYIRAAQVASTLSTVEVSGSKRLGNGAKDPISENDEGVSLSYSTFGIGAGYAF